MVKRRTLLWGTGVGGAVALGGSLWREAAAQHGGVGGAAVVEDKGGYGALRAADDLGIRLPEGFTARLVAQSTVAVEGTDHLWHSAPDGGACFATDDGWIIDAYTILSNTMRNCAGGATPWHTWLSCEEHPKGYVYETDPRGLVDPVRRKAMGRFRHEAAAPDPDRRVVYLTEDEPDGCFYRFVPDTWGDLSTGVLEVLTGTDGGPIWVVVPDPKGEYVPTRGQVSEARQFNGGEGCYYRDGTCYFTTKGDNRVWAYDAAGNTLRVLYDVRKAKENALSGVDNVTGTPAGDLYVAEDAGNMEICVVTPDGQASPFLRVTGQSDSELTGVAFNPAGDRLYFSSQRGPGDSNDDGRTYEVRGPFRFNPS